MRERLGRVDVAPLLSELAVEPPAPRAGEEVRVSIRASDVDGDLGFTTPGWGGSDAPAIGLVAQGGFTAG